MLSKYLLKRTLSTVKGNIKLLHANVTLDFLKPNELTNNLNDNTKCNHVHTSDPLEGQLQVLAFCKLKTLQYHLNKAKLSQNILKIHCDLSAEFDVRLFMKTKEGPIRFDKLDIVINCELNKEKPLQINNKEFITTVTDIAHGCPVYGMISKAEIPETFKVNLI